MKRPRLTARFCVPCNARDRLHRNGVCDMSDTHENPIPNFDDIPEPPEAPVWLSAEEARAWQAGWSAREADEREPDAPEIDDRHNQAVADRRTEKTGWV